jgi:hypothetical protein
MELLVGVLALLASGFLVLAVVVRRTVRAVHRTVGDAGDRARLLARAHGSGPTAEVARLRREMRRALAGADSALDAASAVRAPVGDVPTLLARLHLAAHAVDGELRVLEAQPDLTRLAALLPGPRSRALAVRASAASLVEGLLDAAGHDADDLTLLHAACSVEAEALRAAGRRRADPTSALRPSVGDAGS